MFIVEWLRNLWLWLKNKLAYFSPKINWSKKDHDSDEDHIIPGCRFPNDPNSRIIDEVDHVPRNGPLGVRPVRADIDHVVKRNVRGEIIRLKNPYCIVIINMHYENAVAPRNGAQADLENIEKLLRYTAGFKAVHVYLDVKRKEILETMEDISNSADMGGHDGLLVFISSHGKRKGILMSDRKLVEVEEITSRVNGRQCENLRGKPKLFFIAACRGKRTDEGVPQGPVAPDASEDDKIAPKLPTDADFLICYATTKGYIAHRRYNHSVRVVNAHGMGTWLISSLTQVFEEHMKREDIMQMLTRVNARVANMSSGGDHVDGMKQMPVQMHMLRHRVFLGK